MKHSLLSTAILAAVAIVLVFVSRQVIMESHKEPTEHEQSIIALDESNQIRSIKSRQYDHYAKLAAQSEHKAIATLFSALAHSERVISNNCTQAIELLGSKHSPPVNQELFMGSPIENIKKSISAERLFSTSHNSSLTAKAIDEGNRYAARILIWANGCDMSHIRLLENYLTLLNQEYIPHISVAIDKLAYIVCPTCGNIYTDSSNIDYCHICLTHNGDFLLFSPN